ncbi:D-apiose dehydrogenase [Methylobacterium crusticola]|uniref:D-apiose dehydrogenase n=1 Tax=Methylobacterium crusticola TaxID=1697972 RepID=A0ABQ4R0P6_9HYPH|nr:Gfo/Idh/MocA family oxidoreductase [Methylobacterium crusticola]GJD50876.1 D-apiose dehydrogenase [Methylobacterium crusticola]
MTKPLRVGIIGASAEGGWARDAHVPAVRALDGLELAAIATSRRETADASARAFGVAAAYGDALDLVRAPDIDLVTVAVRVPAHRALVLAALAAGKHVYCEWPLGRDAAEAEEMAAAARAAGVRAAIGLQLRGNPAVRRARALVASGAIGRLLGVSVSSATAAFGPDVPAGMLYAEEPGNGANLVTIQGAHTVDLAVAVAGALRDASALATTRYPSVRVGGERAARTTFDHLLVQGRLAGGGTLSVEVAGGRPPETPFRLEAVGEAGILRLDGGAARGVQSGRLTLTRDGAVQPLDAAGPAGLPEAAINVAGIYAALRDDIAGGTSETAGFEHAARLTRLVEDLLASSRDGGRRPAGRWPEA